MKKFDIYEDPHRRFNPLINEWVLVSPHRAKRPWQGQKETVANDERPEYDSTCYLCPDNVRANGEVNPKYLSSFVFKNLNIINIINIAQIRIFTLPSSNNFFDS